MKILVYGAGVIGCEVAHELCKGENEVTLLARGAWKKTIDEKGLVIRHYGQLKTTVDKIKTIERLEKDDKYDFIFVVMQYNQTVKILKNLAENESSHIVLVGNNMDPEYCVQKINEFSKTEKEIAFGFQGTGGRRENGRVISMHFKVSMTIGGLHKELNDEFKKVIAAAFAKTDYTVKIESDMEGWLLSHAAHVLPTAYICYCYDGNLKKADMKKVKLAVEAVKEAHDMLKGLGYNIRPDGEEEKYTAKSKKKMMSLYFMLKTCAGKFVISNHCMSAVNEMSALDRKFMELRLRAGGEMKAWDELRNTALNYLKK